MSREDLAAGRITCSVYTSPHATLGLDPLPALLAFLKSAKKSIYFGIYALTLDPVAQALIAAHTAGIEVVGVCDATTYRAASSRLPAIRAAGVDLKVWGSAYRLLHDKVAVVDGANAAFGSFNWTTQAEKSNVEMLVITSGTAASKVLAPTLTKQITNAYALGATPK